MVCGNYDLSSSNLISSLFTKFYQFWNRLLPSFLSSSFLASVAQPLPLTLALMLQIILHIMYIRICSGLDTDILVIDVISFSSLYQLNGILQQSDWILRRLLATDPPLFYSLTELLRIDFREMLLRLVYVSLSNTTLSNTRSSIVEGIFQSRSALSSYLIDTVSVLCVSNCNEAFNKIILRSATQISVDGGWRKEYVSTESLLAFHTLQQLVMTAGSRSPLPTLQYAIISFRFDRRTI